MCSKDACEKCDVSVTLRNGTCTGKLSVLVCFAVVGAAFVDVCLFVWINVKNVMSLSMPLITFPHCV